MGVRLPANAEGGSRTRGCSRFREASGKALVVPLSLALAAGCSIPCGYALASEGDGNDLSVASITVQGAGLSGGSESRASLYETYLPVLFRAAQGLGEFAESYREGDSSRWSPEYFLFDLSGDGTPELMVRTSPFEGVGLVRVFTVKADKVVQAGSYWEWFGGSAGNDAGELFTAGWHQGNSYVNRVMLDGGKATSAFLKSGKATEANPNGESRMVNEFLAAHRASWLGASKVTDYSLLEEQAVYDLSKGTMTVAAASAYTGAAQTPAVTVKYGGSSLRQGFDYSVTYRNNTNAGNATVVVMGLGNFRGSLSSSFTIGKADISKATFSVPSVGSFNGASKNPAISIRFGTVVLKPDRDYSITFKNNVKAGKATATVTGRGNFRGSKSMTFSIGKADISAAAISLASAGAYTGSAKKPMATVKLAGRSLKAGTDFTVSYKNNVSAGTGVATISGKGNYEGSKSVSFHIAKAANPLSLKVVNKTVSKAAVSKKAQTVKVLSFKKSAQGKVVFINSSSSWVSKVVSVNKTTGEITVKKGAKKGTYPVKVRVTAAGNGNYRSANFVATAKVVVK